jgi:hypothetical protein
VFVSSSNPEEESSLSGTMKQSHAAVASSVVDSVEVIGLEIQRRLLQCGRALSFGFVTWSVSQQAVNIGS